MIYIIFEEEECEDYVYKSYENIKYVTTNKDDAYNYFNNNCNKEQDTCAIERYILREYKNMSETFQLEIFKDKDNKKYLEKREFEQLQLELEKIQNLINEDSW